MGKQAAIQRKHLCDYPYYLFLTEKDENCRDDFTGIWIALPEKEDVLKEKIQGMQTYLVTDYYLRYGVQLSLLLKAIQKAPGDILAINKQLGQPQQSII